MEYSFPRTYGQKESKERLTQALAQGRFPHALLVHGEPGLGQHALLLDLTQILVCESKTSKPCGRCFSCKAFASGSLESIHYLTPLVKKEKKKKEIERKEDEREVEVEFEEESLNADQVDELVDRMGEWHEQPYAFAASGKAMVRVPQVRELVGRLGYARDKGRASVVLIPWLEALNPEAANALLKTLEEPPADVYFLIASENRATLLPTLLSRCLHLGLSPLSPAEFRETATVLSTGVGKSFSERLLPFAEGSPGVYLELLENGGEELLEESAKFLAAATASDWRIFADYAAAVEGLENAADLLHFLLRCVRVHQSMKARHAGSMRGSKDGYRWTSQALETEGWDSSLSVHLGPLEDVADLPAFTTWLQTALQAVRGYSQPKIALLGLFLEYEAKVHK